MKNSVSSPTLKTVKPIMVFCYICGREYGSKSFSIHIKTCEQKFNNQQHQKINPKQRISLPQPPSLLLTILTGTYQSSTLKTYNDEAYQIFKYKVLPKCKYCQRTFNFESLKVHQKGCDKRPKGPISSSYNDYYDEKQLNRPKALLCCVCGRQFGTKSLKIHYPQCLQKFKNDQFMRTPNPKDRRKPPQFTQQQIQLLNTKQQWTHDEIQQFYKMAMGRYRNESMMQCYNCKRKFIPESLDKHMKNCILINGNLNPQAHLKKVQSQKVLHFYQKNIKKPKTLMCYICGRQFGLTSLSIHQKTCYQKFKIQQQNKPKNERKKLPQLPKQILQGDYNILNAQNWQAQKLQKYNQLISDLYNKKTLVQCYICQRTFFEQSLSKHIVHCQNTLQKLKFKRNKSCDQNQIVKRCQSIQKLRKLQKQKSVQKQIIKPRVLMCHICGRQFGTNSLQIHLKVCQQKFKTQQSLKQKQERKPLPSLPQQLQKEEYSIKFASQWPNQKIEHYNKKVYDIYNKKTLQQCYICERTFVEESLVKHMKHCEKYALQKIKRSPSLNQKQMRILNKYKQIQKQKQAKQSQYYALVQKSTPKHLVCHICGRSYGLTSLQIHIPNCIKKFNDFQGKKPVGQRKTLPSIQNQINSQQFDISTAQLWSKQKIQMYNQVCNRIYNHKSLTKCQYCQRTFFDQQIKKHMVFCQKQTLRKFQNTKDPEQKKKQLLKKSQSANLFSTSSKQIKNVQLSQPKVLFCHICGRQFGLYSLKIHLPQCIQKFKKQQSLKPQQKRKKLPELSLISKQQKQNNDTIDFNIQKAETWNMQQIKRYNQICKQVYMKQSLYQCEHCGRCFKQQQLPKHVKFCQKDPFKKVKKTSQNQNKNEQNSLQKGTPKKEIKQQIYFQQKLQIYETQKKQSSHNRIMSIIQQQQLEHSTISPLNKNKYDSQKNSKIKEFNLIPLELSYVLDQQKQPSKKTKTIQNQQTHKNSLNSSQMQLSKSTKNLSMKKPTFSARGIRKSLSTNSLNLNTSLTSFRQVSQKQEKQCQHCKKKVKQDLYQRHLQMCKSNASMTGYLRKDVPKLKV